jgi:hypothetical protein
MGGASHADRALSGLGGDVVSPALVGMLIDQVPHNLLGWIPAVLGTNPRPRGGDRAEALERGFERLWRDESLRVWDDPDQRPVAFDRGFLSLYYAAGGTPRAGVPLWLPNATDSRAGRRVLPSAFTSDDPTQWPFVNTRDTLALLSADLPISAAIGASARAAFLTPAGDLMPLRRDDDLTDPHYSNRATAVVDGGYADNTGLLTALDLIRWLQGPEAARAAGNRPVQPILIQASALDDNTTRCGGSPKDDPAASDSQARPMGLLATTIGPNPYRGDNAGLLERAARDAGCPRAGHPTQSYFHFALHNPPEASLPINWTLSDSASAWIWLRAMRTCDNAHELTALRASLTGQNQPGPQAACGGGP